MRKAAAVYDNAVKDLRGHKTVMDAERFVVCDWNSTISIHAVFCLEQATETSGRFRLLGQRFYFRGWTGSRLVSIFSSSGLTEGQPSLGTSALAVKTIALSTTLRKLWFLPAHMIVCASEPETTSAIGSSYAQATCCLSPLATTFRTASFPLR